MIQISISTFPLFATPFPPALKNPIPFSLLQMEKLFSTLMYASQSLNQVAKFDVTSIVRLPALINDDRICERKNDAGPAVGPSRRETSSGRETVGCPEIVPIIQREKIYMKHKVAPIDLFLPPLFPSQVIWNTRYNLAT